MKLVASMVVKDELGRYLEDAVASLVEFCDEVRVLDDGSADGSAEWLQAQPHVTVLRSDGSSFFGHEGQARQRLLEWTLRADPTHVLAVDADEFVSDGWAVRYACAGDGDAWTLVMQEVWETDGDCLCLREDGGWRSHPVPILWRVPADVTGLAIANRALACGRVPTAVGRAFPSGADILHFGWANRTERAARHERYVVADGGKFHASSHLDSIMWPDDKVRLEGRPWPASLFRLRRSITASASVPPGC